MIETVFMFNSNSADKPPGKGVLETIDGVDTSIYEKLSGISHWRRILSNSYKVSLEFENLTWSSVDHYCCSKSFSIENPMFHKFSENGEYSELNTSQLKKILTKQKIDFDDACEKYMEVALLQKFSDKNKCLKDALLCTHTAKLTYWNRGTSTIVDSNENRLANPCFLSNTLERIRNTLIDNPEIKTSLDQDNTVIIESSQTDVSKGLKILAKKEINDFQSFMDNYDPSQNRSFNVLTIYEKTNIIGIRMEQLSMGAHTYLNNKQVYGLNNVKDIAFKEFGLKKIPFLICRKFSDNVKEYWRLEDLIH